MKIKPPSRKHIIRAQLKKTNPHWWLIESKPRPRGRLAQLNKFNSKRRIRSEFQVMVRSKEGFL